MEAPGIEPGSERTYDKSLRACPCNPRQGATSATRSYLTIRGSKSGAAPGKLRSHRYEERTYGGNGRAHEVPASGPGCYYAAARISAIGSLAFDFGRLFTGPTDQPWLATCFGFLRRNLFAPLK